MTNTIQIMPGAEGIKQAYRMSLQADKIDIVCLSENYEAVTGDFFEREFAPGLYDGSRVTREILPDSPDNRAYAKKKSQKNQVRFMKGFAESDLLLTDTAMILVSYNPGSPFAAVITDSEIVKGIRAQFEALWERLV